MAWDDDDQGSLWSRPFDFAGVGAVTVNEEWGVGIGGTVWEGGVIAARYCASPAFAAAVAAAVASRAADGVPSSSSSDPRATCIELGAGVSGLPSIVAAARGDLFARVDATDIDECMDGLRANVKANLPAGAVLVEGDAAPGNRRSPPRAADGWDAPASVVAAVAAEADACGRLAPAPPPPPSVSAAAAAMAAPVTAAASASPPSTPPVTVRVFELDWAHPDAAPAAPPYDVVLVADAVYVAGAMPALVAALRHVSRAGSLVILAYYVRSASAHAAFWPRVRAAFEVTAIDCAAFGCGSAQGAETGLFRLVKKSDAQWQREEAARAAAEAVEAVETDG